MQVYIFMLLWYQFFNGFSGITMVDDYNLILFNLVFTSLPPIVLGIFDQDVSAEILFMRPKLYHQGPKNEVLLSWLFVEPSFPPPFPSEDFLFILFWQVYKKHSYFVCLLDAIWQSLVEFFIPYFVSFCHNWFLWYVTEICCLQLWIHNVRDTFMAEYPVEIIFTLWMPSFCLVFSKSLWTLIMASFSPGLFWDFCRHLGIWRDLQCQLCVGHSAPLVRRNQILGKSQIPSSVRFC